MPQITRQTERVLAALLRDAHGHRYGLQISREAGLKSGTLYPILARLEAADWVVSEWERIDPSAEGRRPRRYYRLTGEGRRIARAAVRETQTQLRGLLRPDWERP
jgi:PadR family transcriptional regulator, regulatory protein PadR